MERSPSSHEDRWVASLRALYGDDRAERWLPAYRRLMASAMAGRRVPSVSRELTERDVVLIAYADHISEPGVAPLETLRAEVEALAGDLVSCIHVLPFFPSSSDGGFAVVDFDRVDERLGTWGDVGRLAARFDLMVDLVLNHVSARSDWFQGFLAGDPRYADYFISVPQDADLSCVVRPRALPLVTEFDSPSGRKRVWTTFSADQVDLNYANPRVLLEVTRILLAYVARGASFIRLDAVAFVWKSLGTPCIHLGQAHEVVRYLRAVLDVAAPHVLLVSETNVPHAENVSYFGRGADEAQLVYQFPLPPLVLSAFQEEDPEPLARWLRSIDSPPDGGAFLNFLASHDGIGLRPVEGVLSPDRVEALSRRTLERGGRISYRTNPDGTATPYELNISYYDALSDERAEETRAIRVRRFLAAQAIMLSVAGVPGIYFHSLFGSRSWRAGIEATGMNRTINRQKLGKDEFLKELADPRSLRARVFEGFRRLLRARRAHPAFHPRAVQEILDVGPGIFAVRRTSSDDESVTCLHNVTAFERPACVNVDSSAVAASGRLVDLLSGVPHSVRDGWLTVTLAPYGVCWLSEGNE